MIFLCDYREASSWKFHDNSLGKLERKVADICMRMSENTLSILVVVSGVFTFCLFSLIIIINYLVSQKSKNRY